MKCRLVTPLMYGPDAGDLCGSQAGVGTIIDHEDAWKLVQRGVAVPADDECEQRANMTAAQMAQAQHAYQRTSRGIVPEDFAAFDAGIMDGYYPDGTWKPGPNAAEHEWEQRKSSSPIYIVESFTRE